MNKIFEHKKIRNKSQSGFNIIETLIYIAIFSAVAILTVNAMVVMSRSFRETTIHADLMQGGVVMERLAREIRQAVGINTFNTSDLKLDTKDQFDVDKTVRFLLSGTDIEFYEDDVLTGNLNSPDIEVTALSFTEITTTEGKGIKVVLTIESANDTQNRAENFYNTIILRGNY